MTMKPAAYLAFVLNTVLFATYYAVAKNALGHIDPVLFSFFEMTTLAPVGLCLLLFCRRRVTRALVRHGVLVGSSLCLALFTISIALKYTSATSTAFFPSLNGFLAALIAWLVLRQPVRKETWIAGVLSVVGTTMLILNSSMDGLRGVLIAFLGGVFFTVYVFLSDSTHASTQSQHDTHRSDTSPYSTYEGKELQHNTHEDEQFAPLPLFGVELVTMALWACLIVLLFGDWHAMRLALPQDAETVLYVAGACTFLPTLIAVVMQKHVSAVTVSFIYILEPVFGAIIANLYLHETLPLYGYLGGALVVVGALIHTWGTTRDVQGKETQETLHSQSVRDSSGHVTTEELQKTYTQSDTIQERRTSHRHDRGQEHVAIRRRSTGATLPTGVLVGVALYPCVLIGASLLLFHWMGGLPPLAWRVLYTIASQNTLQNYYGLYPFTVDHILVLAQSLCWLLAWGAFTLAVFVAVRYAYRTLYAALSVPEQLKEISHATLYESHSLRPTRQPVTHEAGVLQPSRQRMYASEESPRYRYRQASRTRQEIIEELDTVPVFTSHKTRAPLEDKEQSVYRENRHHVRRTDNVETIGA